MSGTLKTRSFLVLLLIASALYMVKDTFTYYTMSESDKVIAIENGKLDDMQKNMIHRGLDLQGGMHVVLEVDLAELIRTRIEDSDKTIENLITSSLETSLENGDDFFQVFGEEVAKTKLRLARYFPSYEKGPNAEVLIALEADAKDAVDRAEEIIRNRVDQFGVSEPTIQRSGQWRIIVELAGVTDQKQARELIQATALLEFVLVQEDPQLVEDFMRNVDRAWVALSGPPVEETSTDSTVAATPTDSSETVGSLAELLSTEDGETDIAIQGEGDANRPFSSLVNIGSNMIWVPESNLHKVKRYLAMPEVLDAFPEDVRLGWSNEPRDLKGDGLNYYALYLLKKQAELTGEVITSAKEAMGGFSGAEFVVNVGMNDEGATKWTKITAANIEKRVAIVMDGVVKMAPVIRSKIADGRTQIEGLDNILEAKQLAVVLRAGALPAPMVIEEERTVGASLGNDSVNAGTNAVIIGFFLVVAFILVYYKGAGLIADFALFLNLLFTLAVLSTLNATLTMPGIAGLILTLGMAVDANVLIFERIREELRNGKTVLRSVEDGYARALTTIVDANLTTILAAGVLWQFGSGTIKGFATTLFWGILTSMITAIFITRTIFMILTNRRTMMKLSI